MILELVSASEQRCDMSAFPRLNCGKEASTDIHRWGRLRQFLWAEQDVPVSSMVDTMMVSNSSTQGSASFGVNAAIGRILRFGLCEMRREPDQLRSINQLRFFRNIFGRGLWRIRFAAPLVRPSTCMRQASHAREQKLCRTRVERTSAYRQTYIQNRIRVFGAAPQVQPSTCL